MESPNPVLSEPKRLAWKSLYLVHVAMMAKIEESLAQANEAGETCTFADYDVMYTLEQSPEKRLPLGELVQHVTVSASGLSRRLNRLEDLGWIKRERVAGDRRSVTASLTPEGQAILDTVWPAYARTIAESFASAKWKDADCYYLHNLMVRLLEGMNQDKEKDTIIHRPF